MEIPDREFIEAELSRRSLHAFVRYFAWPVLVGDKTPFVDNWHIHAICDHLEAVSRGEIEKLLINMPFRMLKSTIISHAFPAWEWIKQPDLQYMCASYSMAASTKDSVNSRHIIESAKYQRHFGDSFKMTGDQNVKTFFQNDKGGHRFSTAPGTAGTGWGANRRIVDDPISAEQANSLIDINKSIEWYKGTLATRDNGAGSESIVIVHQRLNENDLTGYILKHEKELGWEHLILPMRYEAQYTKSTKIGFKDPRTTEGELMHPARLDEDYISKKEKTIGAYHTNAQYQQRPDSRGGNLFKRDLWKFYKALPNFEEIIISADCTFKDTATSDFVAIQAWGRKGADKYLLHRTKERMGFAATVIAIRAVKAKFHSSTAVLIEDKANGSAVIETLKKEIAGVLPINPEGGKVARAYAVQPEQESGNIYLPDPEIDPNIEIFLTEVSAFPTPGVNDDEVDAFTQAVNWMRNRKSSGADSLFEAMKKDYEAKQAALQKKN